MTILPYPLFLWHKLLKWNCRAKETHNSQLLMYIAKLSSRSSRKNKAIIIAILSVLFMWKNTHLCKPLTALDVISSPQAGAESLSCNAPTAVPLMQLAVPDTEICKAGKTHSSYFFFKGSFLRLFEQG